MNGTKWKDSKQVGKPVLGDKKLFMVATALLGQFEKEIYLVSLKRE